jgi:hypothetical protein
MFSSGNYNTIVETSAHGLTDLSSANSTFVDQ